MFVAQAIATDGLQPPRKAVKLEVFREDEPDVQWLRWFEGQASGAYRVQYQEWSDSRPFARYRAASEPEGWITVADLHKEGSAAVDAMDR